LFPPIKEHGLTAKDLTIGKKQLEKIVEGYTRESGVRGLEAKKYSSNSWAVGCDGGDY
jgi:ATP-dependent Lon protease